MYPEWDDPNAPIIPHSLKDWKDEIKLYEELLGITEH
jgi:hypothetical protein